MNNETPPDKTPSQRVPHWAKGWTMLTGIYFVMVVILLGISHSWPHTTDDWLRTIIISLTLCALIGGFTLLCWQIVRCFISFSWLQLKRLAFLLACLATLTSLFYAEEDWRGWHAWNQFKQTWEAKGETFSLASLAPPPVPDEQNFALTPLVASCYESLFDQTGKEFKSPQTNVVNRMNFNLEVTPRLVDFPSDQGDWRQARFVDLTTWQTYFQALALKTNRFPISAHPQSPAADVLLALGAFAPGLEELRNASLRPYSRFPLNYDKEFPSDILLPHLAPLKQTAQTLRLRAVAELQNGQPTPALEDIQLSLRLADSIRTEPCLISHLVRIAIIQITFQPIWEGLAKHQWNDPQLATLDKELAKLDFAVDYQRSLRGEQAMICVEMDQRRQHRKLMAQSPYEYNADTPTQINWLVRFMGYLPPAGWFYQNELHYARLLTGYYLPVTDAPQGTFSPALARECSVQLKLETQSPTPFNLLTRVACFDINSTASKFAHSQAGVTLARTAIALERYRLRHQEYPATLDPLTPEFLTAAPKDAINGTPLKYQRTASGQFILYSVGWNETDDGGSIGLTKGNTPKVDIKKGDWVWSYPQP